jgi:hypothetical protein
MPEGERARGDRKLFGRIEEIGEVGHFPPLVSALRHVAIPVVS